MLPIFTGFAKSASFVTGAFKGGVQMSSPNNTCGCSGDQTFNKCKVTRNDCSPGFYPSCDPGPYNCGCECKPAS